MILLEFWGEHHLFSISEIIGILEGEGLRYEIVEDDFPVLVLSVDNWAPLKRAGFLRYISEHVVSSDSIPEINLELENFAVRSRVYFGLRDLKGNYVEREIGKMIRGKVNLDNPEKIVRAPVAKRIHVGVELYDFKNENFEGRKSSSMPISYPITMHPRYTRALINLARVKRGAKILDPFCGTGTILLEGSLMGMDMHGSDLDERMLRASETNLKKFGVRVNLTRRDVGEIEGNYDAIVTDPPYGRSSSSMGEKLNELYERALKRFSDVTDKVSIVLPESRAVEIGKKYFNLREMFPVRVHKSLTRYYCFFERD